MNFNNAINKLDTHGQSVPNWVKEVRKSALERFSEQGIPTRKSEAWKYTSLKPILSHDYQWSHARGMVDNKFVKNLYEKDDIVLVFIDGVLDSTFNMSQSLPEGVVLKSLKKSLQEDEEFLKSHIDFSGAKDDSFLSLNHGFLQEGAMLRVKKGVSVDQPIHLVFVNTAKPKPFATFPKNLVVIEESAKATLLESYVGYEEGVYHCNTHTTVKMESNSCLYHGKIQQESLESNHLSYTNFHLERDAKLETLDVSLGAKLARQMIQIHLNGEGAEAIFDGLFLTTGNQHHANHALVNHAVPHCKSSQLYKGLLKDNGRAVFDGMIEVKRDAQQTNAEQLNKNLVLDSTAEIDTKPQLLIDADDVKCAHGASVGQLDRGQLFYLMSRGLSLAEAKALLCEAFAQEVILKSNLNSFSTKVHKIVTDHLHGIGL